MVTAAPGTGAPSAKVLVRGLLADLGWSGTSVLDLGGIATARSPEHYFLLILGLFGAVGGPLANVAVVS